MVFIFFCLQIQLLPQALLLQMKIFCVLQSTQQPQFLDLKIPGLLAPAHQVKYMNQILSMRRNAASLLEVMTWFASVLMGTDGTVVMFR